MRSYLASAILISAVALAPTVAGSAPDSSKPPFTIDNGPVHDTVVDTMLSRTCTGTIGPIWWAFGTQIAVQARFFQKLDGTKWVRWYYNGFGPEDYPVVELGLSAQWISYSVGNGPGRGMSRTSIAVWPDGDNHLRGRTVPTLGDDRSYLQV
jgi:hypothetical protein